jgi:hypothetical protein
MTARSDDKGLRTYRIRIQGQVDEEFVSAYCPSGTVLARDGDATVLAEIQADQSAMVGLVRHLHNLGCTIVAVES